MGGATLYEGRVEVLYNSRWGVVCEDGWNLVTAEIACSQLGELELIPCSHQYGLETGTLLCVPGYGRAISYEGSFTTVPVSGPVPVWLDDIACNGTETALSACSHSMWGEHNCSPNRAAGVICSGTKYGTWTFDHDVIISISI